MILTIIAEISNQVEKLAIKAKNSNKLKRATQPSASRDQEQLAREKTQYDPLYTESMCHVINCYSNKTRP